MTPQQSIQITRLVSATFVAAVALTTVLVSKREERLMNEARSENVAFRIRFNEKLKNLGKD